MQADLKILAAVPNQNRRAAVAHGGVVPADKGRAILDKALRCAAGRRDTTSTGIIDATDGSPGVFSAFEKNLGLSPSPTQQGGNAASLSAPACSAT